MISLFVSRTEIQHFNVVLREHPKFVWNRGGDGVLFLTVTLHGLTL